MAFWRGNVAAVHRELLDAAAAGDAPAPGLTTLRRAVREALSPGDLAGLRKGEHAARTHDVFLRRPPLFRNAAWEGDHVEAAVEVYVDVDGQLVKPWVTWFIDCATNVVTGVAVTPCAPSRESILAALRAAISVDEPYGPAGGLPQLVRVDRGKDFLSKTVETACAVFAVRVVDLPGYTPHLKGLIETLNAAVKVMFFAGLPRYTEAPRLANGKPADPHAPALRYEAFVAELLAWVAWWNTRHEMDAFDGRTPMQAWGEDPTPLSTVPAGDLRLFTLDIDARADHYLGLAGANVVATGALLAVRDNLTDVLAARAMMCVHGDAGLGKTLSVNASLRTLAPTEVCRVQFRARPTPRDIRHVLFDALGCSGTPPMRPIEFDALLKRVFAERPRVLVCDEAQWLSRECFEFWRHLWDEPRTDIAIVFVGGGDCYRVLKREPMLSSRVYVWQEFRRLTREQVLDVIPVYHPVWAGSAALAGAAPGSPTRSPTESAPARPTQSWRPVWRWPC